MIAGARIWLAVLVLALASPALAQQDSRASVVVLRSTSGEHLGAGVVVTADGYIITTATLAGDSALVRFADQSERAAKLVGTDRHTNVTVLKAQASALVAARIADLSGLVVGEPVVCIDVRHDGEFDVVSGTVQRLEVALRRALFVPYIETNVGNADGPLLNGRGEVIGLNEVVMRDAPERAFAIPIDVAIFVQRQFGDHGRVIRGRLGMVMREVTPDVAAAKGLGAPRGALIDSVEARGPAARAGLKAGDVLLEVGGKPVARSSNAVWLVGALRPGVPTKLRIWRNGSLETLTARAGEVVESPKAQ